MSREWSIIYRSAIDPVTQELFFPERLSREFLENAKRSMGSYLFANQYQNVIIPDDLQNFKKEWIKYYTIIPSGSFNYIFVDPAISQQDSADYTGIVVVAVDSDGFWYIQHAKRYRLTPTEIVNKLFELYDWYKPMGIGIEDVAFQKALIHFVTEEMNRRGKFIPVRGIKPSTDKTKETRILGLVPRFEFGRVFIGPDCEDLLKEMSQFPRGSHDDVLDALAYIEQLASMPGKRADPDEEPPPNHPSYESWYIRQLAKRNSSGNFFE